MDRLSMQHVIRRDLTEVMARLVRRARRAPVDDLLHLHAVEMLRRKRRAEMLVAARLPATG
jgi:hypothetical protein